MSSVFNHLNSRLLAPAVALITLLGARSAVAAPPTAEEPAATEAPEAEVEPEPKPARELDGGFSLDRGAWLSTPRSEFGVGLLAVLRYGATFSRDGVDSLGFSLPFVRPNLHGRLFDGKLFFFVQPELSGANVRLLDAQLIYQPIDAFGIDVGQYRPHLSRAWNAPIPVLALPGRGAVDDHFRSDRALGLTAFGRPFDGKLEYDVGVFNGGGYNLGQPVTLEPLVTARLAVNPLGAVPLTQTPAFAEVDRTLFGVGVHAWTDRHRPEQLDPDTKPIERQRVVIGGDFVLMTPRVHLLVEGFGRWHARRSGLLDAGWGSQAQVGVVLIDETLELQARAGVLDPGVEDPTQGIWEGGLSWYLWGNHLRANLHYACTQTFSAPRGCSTHRAQLQTQFWF